MQNNDNFPFLKKLVETVKQAVDALEPENTEINDKLYVLTSQFAIDLLPEFS